MSVKQGSTVKNFLSSLFSCNNDSNNCYRLLVVELKKMFSIHTLYVYMRILRHRNCLNFYTTKTKSWMGNHVPRFELIPLPLYFLLTKRSDLFWWWSFKSFCSENYFLILFSLNIYLIPLSIIYLWEYIWHFLFNSWLISTYQENVPMWNCAIK